MPPAPPTVRVERYDLRPLPRAQSIPQTPRAQLPSDASAATSARQSQVLPGQPDAPPRCPHVRRVSQWQRWCHPNSRGDCNEGIRRISSRASIQFEQLTQRAGQKPDQSVISSEARRSLINLPSRARQGGALSICHLERSEAKPNAVERPCVFHILSRNSYPKTEEKKCLTRPRKPVRGLGAVCGTDSIGGGRGISASACREFEVTGSFLASSVGAGKGSVPRNTSGASTCM